LQIGQFPLQHALPTKSVAEEVHLLIQQHLNVTEALHFDYEVVDKTLTYYAMPAQAVEAVRALYQGAGVRLAGLEWDVLALRRAFVATSAAIASQPLSALLWVGACSALFGIYTQTGVVFHSHWQHHQSSIETWLASLLESTRETGLRSWQVCCANLSQSSFIAQVSHSFGVEATFIDLTALTVNPSLLAEAFLAFGLALRGLPC
jgi:hypothetical protein